jgi:UDP-N-acetylglucosamine--dolichyl-phosphate N-acetylglucosaminephosphotransferase
MLAGFNGLEAGMGLMACFPLALIAWFRGSLDASLLLFSMSAALFAFLLFNKNPAKILPGDVGTLSVGACIASAIIIGNFEMAGVVVMIPFFFDFALKVKNRFPKELDYIKLKDDKLVAEKPVGLTSILLRLTDGMTESRLVASLVSLEFLFAILAVLLF